MYELSILEYGAQAGFLVNRDFFQQNWDDLLEDDCRQLIRLAIREDLDRTYDWTTIALIPPEAEGRARVTARADGVVAGLPVGRLLVEEFDPRLVWRPLLEDGATVAAGEPLAAISGPARSLLAAERPLLNFIGRLSGVATTTSRFVQAIAGTKARLYDTRKTIPAWRRLEKYAVRRGGGHNHRTGLFDAVLIKDNHLALAAALGGQAFTPAQAVLRARQFLARLPEGDPARDLIVEIEVDSLAQLQDVLPAAPDLVLLDNMSLDDLARAVRLRDEAGSAVELEASGSVRLDTAAAIAATGVDRISAGALTHSAVWLDVALDWDVA